MKIRIELTEEHIALIKNFKFKKINDALSGLDTYDLYGGTYIWEDMAIILGKLDRAIPGTENDPDGRKFPRELMEHFKELDEFILNNLSNIDNILHQFAEEGLKPGVYETIDYEQFWTKIK